MKPFDLEKAKAGAPLCTRDGRPARIVCWDRKHDDCLPLVVLVNNETSNGEIPHTYDIQGRWSKGETSYDLFMAPAKHEGWVNVYRGFEDVRYARAVHDTKADADENTSGDRVACVHIEWEE